ncbi:putative secreted protein (Por secretion system target) [Tenacibaculum gallaicum]|uniref:chitinase n=1 Tax=Tenacibaculum gallaicum TaxID=561505 RepID=A0A3E0HMA9_9FLAO|nr:glycosyl hydrolase family 18 protein [Tenacibaculum gallaicum]REH47561.1 putative secreted protein (Por secretion system target) [Tenacibaculum gallaicum]
MIPFVFVRKKLLIVFFLMTSFVFSQVNTGGTATTANHQKQVIGYITNWDAWKTTSAGVPSAGALTHLNIDYSKYTILNYSFFGVANDGSLHSGDHRNKQIYQEGTVQAPNDIFMKDIYSSWDMHILFGEIDPIQHVNEAAKKRAEAQGFQVMLNGSSWTQPTWGLSGQLPIPLHKENGAPGLIELAHKKGVKVMASIGGWSMCKHFPEMAADPVKRARFIKDCKKLIATGFDGIDLDWEYPGPYSGMNFTGSQADFANFETLVQEIRAAIGPDKLITAAMSADPRKLEGFNWSNLSNNMDYFNMMTYDMNGGWSNKAGHNAPIYPYSNAEVSFFNWQSTLQKLEEKGVPKNKICFGAPFYGRGVITEGTADLNVKTVKRAVTIQPDGPIQTASDYTNWKQEVYDGTPNYFFIKQKALAPNSGWTRKWDNEAKVPYLVKGNFFLSYDDEESIGIKAQFINDNQLGGTIIWTVYGDLEISGTATSFGTKLKRWSNVKSPLVNKINEVFANGNTGENKLPVINITAPSNNTNYNEGDTIIIKADATDSDGVISKVEFFNDNIKLGEDTTSPYEYTWQNATVTTHKLTAKATDNDGGSTTSSIISIVVNGANSNKPPAVILASPADNAVFDEGQTIELIANASDIDGTISKVEFFNETTKLGEDLTNPYSYSIVNASIGTYTLTAKATDDKGLSSTSSVRTVKVTADTIDNCNGIADWSATTTYNGGENVKYKNVNYQAKWWTKNNVPDTHTGDGQPWKKVKDCSGAGDNIAPTINITSPVSNSSFKEGSNIEITADAFDDDGSVSKVEFFNGSIKLGKDTTNPYNFTISNAGIGTYSLTAKATDDKNASTTSVAVQINIEKDSTGGDGQGCNNVPNYIAGTSYNQNEEVQNEGNKYKCNIAGWCSSSAAWAYAPGTGTYWKDAWSKVSSCEVTGSNPKVSIISPQNGAIYVVGSSIEVKATATDDEAISKVAFYNGSTKLGEDTAAPYTYTITNAQAGSYSLTAKAYDNENNSTISSLVVVTDGVKPPISNKILVGYWHNFNNGSTIPKLRDVSKDWDVICVAFAEPKSGSKSEMKFTPFEIYNGNINEFKNDIRILQGRGQKVLISIGGANAHVELNNNTEKNQFVSSMTSIINTYGFDGLDIDLEGSSLSLAPGDTDFRNPTTPKIINLIEGTKAVINNVGASKFTLSMAPETAYVQGAYGNYSGVFGAYLPVIHALRNQMDYIHVQHYNTGSMFGRDGKIYQPATADFHVAMSEMLITGFKVGQTGLNFPGLRANQVAIGLPAEPRAAGSGYTSETVVQQALDYLIKGVSYPNRTYTTSTTYPEFRGLMTWSINWDLANNAVFSTSHRAYLDNLGLSGKVIEKNEVLRESSVTVYPNPIVKDVITFKIFKKEGSKQENLVDYKLQIFNATGKNILTTKINSKTTQKPLNIEFLESGLYFYILKNGAKKHLGKFIKAN